MTHSVRIDDVLPRFPIEQRRLANGLRVVVQADRRWPLIASVVCYAAGSRRDPIGRSGLAHVCEHLGFYGPRSLSGRTFPERIEAIGGSARAVTMPDRLCYSSVFPSRDLRAVLAVEAERMACPLNPDDVEELEIQRRVLLEELRQRSQNRLRAAAFEHIHRCLYPEGHAYHRPPAGEPDGIRAVTVEDVRGFVTSHFTPGNAVVVLVGDVSPDVIDLVSHAFDRLPAGIAPDSRPALPSPAPRAARRVQQSAAVSRAQVHVAWSVAGFGQDEWCLAALLMRGLAVGRSSPLAKELIDRTGLAQDVRGSLVSLRDSSTLVLGATAGRGVESTRLERGLIEASDQLLSAGLSSPGLVRARNKALSDHYLAVESFERRADLCASLACYLDAPERLESQPQRYQDVNRETIVAFASGLRQDTDRAVMTLVPMAVAA